MDWAGLEKYFTTVAAASDRVEIVDAGPSTEKRRLIAAVVSAPENIARLEEIRTNARRLADPRTLDAPAAMALAARQPVIVALGMSIHATEIGATLVAPELLHSLATSQDPEALRSLRDVALILFPSLNPDGHVMTVDWYRKWKGTEFEGTGMPWLYHRYVGHDINRDSFMMNMAENRTLADFFYRRWHPQVFLSMHQMGPRGARYFVPPNADPRWLLEQYEFPFENITDADIRRGGLRARFDAIVLPDMSADRMITGRPAGTMPPEYVGGLGTEGTEALRQFVANGGTLVALDSASELAINVLGAPVRDVTRGLPSTEYFCPGSVIRLELDEDPLTYGAARETAGVCAFNGAYELLPAGAATARVIGRYATSGVLLSGWLEGERAIAGKGAMVEVKSGLGRAILFGFRPQHRAQSHATFRLFFNSLHTSR